MRLVQNRHTTQLAKYMGPIWVVAVSKWAGYMGPTWAAHITPTVYVFCPFSPYGTQSSFAPWLPSLTHLGQVVQVGFWYMGPMWAAPDLSHVGFWYMGPMWAAPDFSHVGYWDTCGQPQIYPMWATGIWDPCG